MIRLIAITAFTLGLATAAEAMPVAPLHQPNGMITQARVGRPLTPGSVAGVHRRHVRRSVRRCAVYGAGHVCTRWHYVYE
jgi:hypothetical protein